ncbi:hypothetical protein DVH24_027758 [Malus domestica]|uniref:Uncharacterized protein n=1 Tax=Malus domestica TaxID=3750 RepID=A0A498HER3_MALDO|nr:hypothetical protein DVH24_027758 [Malus domestica]
MEGKFGSSFRQAAGKTDEEIVGCSGEPPTKKCEVKHRLRRLLRRGRRRRRREKKVKLVMKLDQRGNGSARDSHAQESG